MCPVDYTAVATSGVAVITTTNRPKSVRNRFAMDVFGGIFLLSRCFFIFLRASVIGLSQISSFFSLNYNTKTSGATVTRWGTVVRSCCKGLYILASKRKGYTVICWLFYRTEWHILFAYCKHNVCCFRVDLPNLNQVQWSETSARQFEWFCMTCTISQLLGTMEVKYSLW